MTIGNARRFIKRAQHEKELRNSLNRASDTAELSRILEKEDLAFSSYEFEEAFSNKLTQCQTADEVEQLQQLKIWWTMLSGTTEAACGAACSGCSAGSTT